MTRCARHDRLNIAADCECASKGKCGVLCEIDVASIQSLLEELDQDEVDIRSRLYQRIHELETQLAQLEQEPVAWRAPNWGHGNDEWVYRDFDDPVLIADGKPSPNNEALYTTPPQRKPLTDEQIYEIHENSSNLMEFTRAIEAAHGIK